MENKIYLYTIACCLLTVSSCNDFLEISPKSEGTSDITYKTDKDFNDAVIGAYREFQDVYDFLWRFGDLPGEDVRQAALRDQEHVRIDNFALDVNDNVLLMAWVEHYQVIERVNTLLSKIEEADASNIINKDQYIGEAKFLRALAYFNLVRIFGDVPLVTAPLTIDATLETVRTNVDVIYSDLIINDLLDAETKLPEKYSEDAIGKATKGAAMSLLGKVYLTTHDFAKAESKLMEVTTMGYSLLDDFEDLFDFDNEHHSEYIFDIEYIDGNIGLGSNFTRDFLVETQDVGAFRKDLTRVWGIQGPEGGGRVTPSLDFIALFDPNDLRQYRTATTGIFDHDGTWIPIPEDAALDAITLKYIAPIETDGKANWKVIRYADVLLMLAEALNENGKTTEAISYLNQIRTRAGLTGYVGLSQSEVREKIYLERRFELFMEGHRWFDLLRTGQALEVGEPLGMEPHNRVFPIPQSQIEVVNDPSIFAQNPGY